MIDELGRLVSVKFQRTIMFNFQKKFSLSQGYLFRGVKLEISIEFRMCRTCFSARGKETELFHTSNDREQKNINLLFGTINDLCWSEFENSVDRREQNFSNSNNEDKRLIAIFF
jgi:hypothetical protein